MSNLKLVQKELNKYSKMDRLEVYKRCIKERLTSSLQNYNNELNQHAYKLERNVDGHSSSLA